MPCFHPLQAYFSLRGDGKKDIRFSNVLGKMFREGVSMPSDSLSLPCGRCIGCRLEKSRQWAVRCLHESKKYEDNCFLTLTFDNEHLAKMCPTGSIDRRHVQDFMKRLRKSVSGRKIRVFYCGEYGAKLSRPHYHLCLFNFDFADKVKFKCVNGVWLYVSEILGQLWPFGHSSVGSFTFESAAYVARYCTKKVSGSSAEAHYSGLRKEFAGMSLKPGIGRSHYDEFRRDIYPLDEVVVKGVRCKPPRYYDKKLEEQFPLVFAKIRADRVARARKKCKHSTYSRLLVREKCQEARFSKLCRSFENGV